MTVRASRLVVINRFLAEARDPGRIAALVACWIREVGR